MASTSPHDLTGRVALVTGANTGIGLVTARELARRGAHVFVACRSLARAENYLSLVGLVVKVGLVLVAGVSLVRLASAYQERMERQGELSAVLDLEQAKLSKARERFDQLFMVEGEQRLIREQNQWIAPNRLRVVWKSPDNGRPNP
jgi:NAD(P)-dependent dehydrogenase (short-subunit alcohol dehydrogenase family)